MKENQPKYIVQDIVCASRSTPIKGLGRINRRRAVTAERVLDGQERRAAMSAKSAFERWGRVDRATEGRRSAAQEFGSVGSKHRR